MLIMQKSEYRYGLRPTWASPIPNVTLRFSLLILVMWTKESNDWSPIVVGLEHGEEFPF
jgi:hypothetical protein